jgi:hypothetical protein
VFIKKKNNSGPAERLFEPKGVGAEDVTDIEARVVDAKSMDNNNAGLLKPKKKGVVLSNEELKKGGLFSRLKRPTKKAMEPAEAKEPESEAAAKKSFFGVFAGSKKSRKQVDESRGRAEPNKKPLEKSSTSPKGGSGRAGQADVLVELESGKRVYWRVTADDVTQVAPEAVREALSFSRHDHRFSTEKTLSYKGAEDLALSELGEAVRLVNGSKVHRAVYAALETRVEELKPVSIGPGLHLVDEFVRQQSIGRTQPNLLVVVHLQSADMKGQSLGIFLHLNESGELSPIQIAVNPENLDLLLSQFSAARRFSIENADVLNISNKEFLALASATPAYPQERLWNGLSLRKTIWAAAMAGILCTGLGWAYAGYAFLGKQAAQQEDKRLSTQVQQIRSGIDELARASLKSFAARFSINVNNITTTAASLWNPGTRVNVEASPSQQAYNIVLPLTIDKTIGRRPVVAEQIMQKQVDAINSTQVPDNCSKSIPKLSGGLNVYQITVVCENPDSGIRGIDLN